MRRVRAGAAPGLRGGSSRPRHRPLIYRLCNQQRRWGAKARLENWLFNLFTFDIQPPLQALILAPTSPSSPPTLRALCALSALGAASRCALAPPRPRDHLSQSCAATRGGPGLCSGGRRLRARCTPARPHLRGRRGGGEALRLHPGHPGPAVLATLSPALGHSLISAAGPRRPWARWRRVATLLSSPISSLFP